MSNIKTKTYRVLVRFIKAFASGFVASIGLITLSNVHTFSDFQGTLSTLAVSGLIGGVNGVLMAAEKAFNWKDAEDVTPPTPTTPDVGYIEID